MKNNNGIKTFVAVGIGAALFFVLGRFVAIPSPVPNTNISLQYAVLALLAAMYGPVAGGLIGFIGHALIDLSWGGIPWWSWVITSAFVGIVVGLFTQKLHVEEGNFNKKKVGVFALANVIANLIGFIGHALIDLSWGGIPWWSWVITSAFVGVVVGLFTKKLHVEEGDFNKKKVGVFALANVIANLIGWIVVAPVLDILIYAEPAKKVFAQGVFAGISNSITAVVVGGLLVLAYTKTIAKKGSLDKE